MNQDFSSISKLKPSLRTEIPGYESLEYLALNLIWSWNHQADRVWRQLDPILWELTFNPWLVLQTVSLEKLTQLLNDLEFRKIVDHLLQLSQLETSKEHWFQTKYPDSPLKCVAYFSMEFMLSEALPIYSGGLGNVAGDQLKSASDLGVPVIGIGLLYQQGYFRQLIDREGWQQPFYPYNEPGQLPISPLRKENGEWLRLEIAFPGWSLWLRTWQVRVGNVTLLLLDTNDSANLPAYRGITNELYGGGPEQRLQQEMILGIGGWRLLNILGIKPDVCHLNEGHAAFAVLERAYTFMQEMNISFEEAFAVCRAGNLFTTHTAVAAGFDRFSPALMEQYLGRYVRTKLQISMDAFMALGRENPSDGSEPFNMAYLAVRGSGAINAVSQLHGQVSRQLFEPLFPHWPEDEVPIGSVTNGIHVPSWVSAAADKLWAEECGEERWLVKAEILQKKMQEVSLEKVWAMRAKGREDLIQFARARLARQLASKGATNDEVEYARTLFDPNILTLGFARRFATYKRPNLLLHNPDRLIKILTNASQPVQLILAGKAHPADKPGQNLIHEWMTFIRKPECQAHVIFLSDYDMLLTERMVQGVDVWLNTPRRPWEACGTSGMKILVNGGLNCSELDGWWQEAYSPEVGWALGDGLEHAQDPSLDEKEANALYDLLEKQIIPEFYERNSENIPLKWVEHIKSSMTQLTPFYSANRSVREYSQKYYLPSAMRYKARIKEGIESVKHFCEVKKSIEEAWKTLSFGEFKSSLISNEAVFEIDLFIKIANIQWIKVELFANKQKDEPVEIHLMNLESFDSEKGVYRYKISLFTQRSVADYTVRVMPAIDEMNIPLEFTQILWQK